MDLVKRNLELAIRIAKDDLVSLEEFFAGRDHIFPDGGEMAELRRAIEDLKRKLKALEDEGRP